MSIRLPKEFQVGPFEYTIDTSDEARARLIGTRYWGETQHSVRQIRLDTLNPSPQELDNTVIHELVHCIENVYLDTTLEERTVAVLANGLHQILRQLGITFKVKQGVSP